VSLSVSIQNSVGSGIDRHALALPVGYLGAALGVAMVVPQIVRTLRNPALPGVSATSWGLSALASLTWLLYGVRADEVPQIPGNLLMVIGSALIVLAVPSALGVPARVVRLGLPALALIGLAAFVPPSLIGLAAFAIGIVAASPQLVKSLTGERSAVSAVSVPAWVLRGASQVTWLAYALILHDVVVTVSATFGLVSSAVLVISEIQRRPAVVTDAGGLGLDALSDRRVQRVEAGV
jgi:uncharacterized protein with PQ loop repeat